MALAGELDLARARIARAQDNIKEFAEILSRYLELHPAEVRVSIDEQGQGAVRVVRRDPIPVQLPVLLGETLQNLRAGLDNCLYAVAIIDSGTTPPPGAAKLQWPIAVTPREWTENRKRLQHLSPHLIDALHQIQPFQAKSPGWNCLRILHDLARVDRHRAPHELAMWLETVKGTYDKKAIKNLAVREGPVGGDGIVVTFTKVGTEELNPAMLDLAVELNIDVREVERVPHPMTGKPSLPWGPLDKRLQAICVAVEDYAEGLVEIAQNPELLVNEQH